MPTNKVDRFQYLEDGIKSMIGAAKGFDEKAKAIEVAMKFEALRIKERAAKSGKFGKGFDPAGGEDDFETS